MLFPTRAFGPVEQSALHSLPLPILLPWVGCVLLGPKTRNIHRSHSVESTHRFASQARKFSYFALALAW